MIKVSHPNGYTGILYGRSSMIIFDEHSNKLLHTGYSSVKTPRDLYRILESMPDLAGILPDIITDCVGIEEITEEEDKIQ